MDANRTSDVFDRLLAHVIEAKTELIAHLIVHNARNHNATGIGKRLQPGGHVDAVAKDVIPVNYDVADIDADPKFDTLVCRNTGIACGHTALNVKGAAQ